MLMTSYIPYFMSLITLAAHAILMEFMATSINIYIAKSYSLIVS